MTTPRVSIIVPVYNTGIRDLEECICSVLDQSYSDWELCLVDDRSPNKSVKRVLERAVRLDDRIRVDFREANGGIVAASNSGLAMTRGELVALLDHDDALEPDALMEVVTMFDSDPQIDYVYTDETLMTSKGKVIERFHKPGWSPERYLHQMYVCHLSVIRRSLIIDVGGFRDGFDGSQDYDLMFRVTEAARKVGHVPKLLYHWRMAANSVANNASAKPYAYDAGQRAIESHLERQGVAATVSKIPKFPGNYRIMRETPSSTTVNAFVPHTGLEGHVWGVERRHAFQTAEALKSGEDTRLCAVTLVPDGDSLSGAFNTSGHESKAEFLFLSSEALEPITSSWLDELLQPFLDPAIGIVSGTTYSSTSRFEHAGYFLHGSFLDKAYFRIKQAERGQRAVLETIREVSAVDWQCMLVRRELFKELGGFDESLNHPWCVVDFCLRAAEIGIRTVITPRAEFWEFSNGDDLAWYRQRAPKTFRQKWHKYFDDDPYRPKPPLRDSAESLRPFWRPTSFRDFERRSVTPTKRA